MYDRNGAKKIQGGSATPILHVSVGLRSTFGRSPEFFLPHKELQPPPFLLPHFLLRKATRSIAAAGLNKRLFFCCGGTRRAGDFMIPPPRLSILLIGRLSSRRLRFSAHKCLGNWGAGGALDSIRKTKQIKNVWTGGGSESLGIFSPPGRKQGRLLLLRAIRCILIAAAPHPQPNRCPIPQNPSAVGGSYSAYWILRKALARDPSYKGGAKQSSIEQSSEIQIRKGKKLY